MRCRPVGIARHHCLPDRRRLNLAGQNGVSAKDARRIGIGENRARSTDAHVSVPTDQHDIRQCRMRDERKMSFPLSVGDDTPRCHHASRPGRELVGSGRPRRIKRIPGRPIVGRTKHVDQLPRHLINDTGVKNRRGACIVRRQPGVPDIGRRRQRGGTGTIDRRPTVEIPD